MGWLVEWWEDDGTGNVVLRVHEPVAGSRVRAGLLTVSPLNARDLFTALAGLGDVEVRASDH